MNDSKDLPDSATADRQLQVFVLGRFLVKNGENDLSERCGRSKKIWDLFKYILVHRDSIILPEAVAEQLWPDQTYADAKSTVRTMIYRLRRLLGDDIEIIKFSQGGYSISPSRTLWLDAIAFETSCNQARSAAKEGRLQEAIDHYKQGLALYKGDLLPESAYSDWLIPHRSHYHRRYLQSVVELARLLKQTQSHADIVEETARAVLIDYFEAEIHLLLLEALLAEGRVSQVKSHYENVTGVYYREMGLKPSPAMKRLFQLMRERDDESGNVLDFSAFREALHSRQQSGGAFYCEPEFFRFPCQLESRRAERSGQDGLLVLLSATISDPGSGALTQHATTAALQETLQETLRSSDCFCRFADQQFMLLLPATAPQQGEQVLRRINGSLAPAGLLLKSRLLPLDQPART